jgi:hypothetical protein
VYSIQRYSPLHNVMRPSLIFRAALVVFALFVSDIAVDAQIRKSAALDTVMAQSNQRPPVFSTGVTGGAMSFSGGLTEQALSILFQLQPAPWLSLSAAPGFGRTTLGTSSSDGPTDIPLVAGAQYTASSAPWSPVVAASLSSLLSTGQSGSTLGVGHSSLAAGAALRVSPAAHVYLSAAASRPLTAASGNGSVDLGISRSYGRATPSLGYSSEIGSADSAATLARSIASGVAFALSGPLTLAVDASRGLTRAAPQWSVSVSFGTAFAGLSPMNGGSMFGRLKNAFGSRATSSSGYSTTASCKKAGTC